VMPLLLEHNSTMTPIDSEHSAVFQCLQGYRSYQINEIILTASGGPFRGRSRESLHSISVEQALNHPTWNMGGKITIDSATLMNKGLEMIEARWLFGVEMDQVKVVIHPQSVIHSMVKFTDGSVLGQLGWPNMRLPILYALAYPDRLVNDLKNWDPTDTPNLTFEQPDEVAFPSLGLARSAAKIGGTMPSVMNAANEAVVAAFLEGKCGFLDIPTVVENAMLEHSTSSATLTSILDADHEARVRVREALGI
jgi:1-deoxy-D-xylulose-5-phosphate reductoisomerase